MNITTATQSSALSEFKRQLVQEAARFTKDPESTAAKLEGDVVELASLKTEGQGGFIGSWFIDQQPHPEAFEVLAEAYSHTAKLIDAPAESLRLIPASYIGRDQLSTWVAVQDGSSVKDVYQLDFHQTPDIDGGLMVARQLESRELDQEARNGLLYRPSLSLAHPEDGWQFAIQR
jgi:hypothetical protein